MSTRTAPIAKACPGETGAQVRIGARLRAARRARGHTVEQVAAAAGLTKGFISRLERDDASPSVASLVTVCQVLGVRVGDLFDPPETSVVRAGQGRAINFGGHRTHEQLLTPGTQPHLQLIRATIEVGGGGGDDLYALSCEVECAHVVSGTLEVVFDDGSQVLGPGDTITFPGRAPHTWRNASTEVACEVLWVLAPAP